MMIWFVASVVKGHIDNPAFLPRMPKLVFGRRMMESPNPHELL